MRHKFLVLPVKKLLKSVLIYGSYRTDTPIGIFYGFEFKSFRQLKAT